SLLLTLLFFFSLFSSPPLPLLSLLFPDTTLFRSVFQMHPFHFLFFLIRKNLLGKGCQIVSKRNQKNGGDNIKQRMHVGNLPRHIGRRPAFHQRRKRRQNTDSCKNDRSDDVKCQMDDRRTLCVPACPYGCKHRRNTGTDILSKKNKHRARKSDQTV